MGIIGAQGVGITPPTPDPFVPGQVVSQRGTGMIKDVATGEITYFGTPTSEPQQTTPPEQPKLPDPYVMLEDQLGQETQSLEAQFTAADAELTRKPQYKLQTLESEFEIQDRNLRNKFLGVTPEGKTAQDQLDAYHEALDQLKTQKQIAALRIEDKIQPERDELFQQKQQRLIQLQEAAKEKKIKLDTIKQLGDAGKLDPDAVLHEQLQTMGLNISLSEIRPPDPQQEIRELTQLITYFGEKMDIGKQTMEGYGLTLLSDEEKGTYTWAKERLRTLRLQQNPELAPIINKPRLSDANKAALENKGGTIGTMLRSHGTASRTPISKRVRVVSPDGVRGTVGANEVSQYLAQGYRRI